MWHYSFESNTHTLPPHFELKTDATREIMDTEDVVAIQEKLNYYIVLNSDLSKEKFKSLLKETLFHKSLQVEQRDEQTYGGYYRFRSVTRGRFK